MKQILLLCLVALTFASCEDKKSKEWDFDAMVSLRPAEGVKSANPEHWSAERIVKEATDIWFWNKAIQPNNALGRGFAPVQRDTINMRLLMWGSDIIYKGKYQPDFIEGEDIVLTKEWSNYKGMDTVGYIPNKVLRDAQKVIKTAFDNGDYETVYAEFDQAFTFIPITGKEWLELKTRGEN